jgi:hypothetical protein
MKSSRSFPPLTRSLKICSNGVEGRYSLEQGGRPKWLGEERATNEELLALLRG